jgi:hypothetical protein
MMTNKQKSAQNVRLKLRAMMPLMLRITKKCYSKMKVTFNNAVDPTDRISQMLFTKKLLVDIYHLLKLLYVFLSCILEGYIQY